eukprot:1706041-Amphidinium_carterae.1
MADILAPKATKGPKGWVGTKLTDQTWPVCRPFAKMATKGRVAKADKATHPPTLVRRYRLLQEKLRVCRDNAPTCNGDYFWNSCCRAYPHNPLCTHGVAMQLPTSPLLTWN